LAAPSRAEQRNAAVRAELTPLAPGERPASVTVGAVIAAVLFTANVVLFAVGTVSTKSIGATRTGTLTAPAVIYGLLMLVFAAGMWRTRYWAVLGFMVMLLITILAATLALMRASNLLGFVIPLVVIGGAGTLFYKLIRALSRIQMPAEPEREPE